MQDPGSPFDQPSPKRKRRRRRRRGNAPPVPVATVIELRDGSTVIAHGDRPMTPETKEAVTALAQAAADKIAADVGDPRTGMSAAAAAAIDAEAEDDNGPVEPTPSTALFPLELSMPLRYREILTWAAKVRGISEDQYVSQLLRAALARERVTMREAQMPAGEGGISVRASSIRKVRLE